MVLRCHVDECSPYRIAGWVDDDGPVEAIEIQVNARRIARISPTEYRKDLNDAGIGDGRRAFSFAILPYLVEPTNVVTIRRGELTLHSSTLQLPKLQSASAGLRCHVDECSPYRIAGWVDDDGPVEAIEIQVNDRRIARISPTEYRKDLNDAGIGDGRRAFSFAISPYLVEPTNVVTIRRGELTLHSSTLRPPNRAATPSTGINASLIKYLRSQGLREKEQDFFLELWREHFDAAWYLRTYPDVAEHGMEAFEHYLKYGLKEGWRRPCADVPVRGPFSSVDEADIQCVKRPVFEGEVGLFVTYSPTGRMKPHVRYYLDALRRHNIRPILIVATDQPFVGEADLVSAVDGMFVRQNHGFDFAAWAHVLRLHPELFNAEILYLLNDSVVGPTDDAAFGRLLRRLRDSPADCIGLTENYVWAWHYQSYFLALKRRALRSDVFQKFAREIVSFSDKQDVIHQYEFCLAWLLQTSGLKLDVLFPLPHFGDPTIFDWDSLLQLGFPFLKVNTIRDSIPNVDTGGWRDLLAAQGYDISLAEGTLEEVSTAALRISEVPVTAVRWFGIQGKQRVQSTTASRDSRRMRPKGGWASRSRVLICGHELSESGAPRAAFDVARALRDAGHSVVFASPSDGPYRERLCNIGVEVVIDEMLLDQDRDPTFPLAFNFDKVFCNTIVCWPIVEQLCDVIPVYWYIHESGILHEMVNDVSALLPVLRGGATVLAPSCRVANALAVYGLTAPIIEYGIEELSECYQAPSLDIGKVVIGVFGSYELRKGQDLAVAGMLSVPREVRAQAELRFFGRTLSQVFRDNLGQVAGDECSIAFFDEVSHCECLKQMAACDVILSPSRDDPLPFVTLDALCLGKTVVCSHATGTSAYIEDGQSGLILRHNTPKEIGTALTRVITDPGLRGNLGKGARVLYKRIFTMQRFAKRLHASLGIERPQAKTGSRTHIRNIGPNISLNIV